MNSFIRSLNLNEGAVLTLEKLEDRMEFEALVGAAGYADVEKTVCIFKVNCTVCPDCASLCTVCPTDCPTYCIDGCPKDM